MLDILRIDPSDSYAVAELNQCLQARLKPTEVEDLLFVLDCWERTLTDADRLHLARYQRRHLLGEITAVDVRRHLVCCAAVRTRRSGRRCFAGVAAC